MPNKMKCPNCGRRVFDISHISNEELEISLKCPQCKKLVAVPCNEMAELKTKKVKFKQVNSG
jgi:hypothetical protein